MRKITPDRIIEKVIGLAREANFVFPEALAELVDQAIVRENSAAAKQALSAILANVRLAQKLPLPICQDTGMVEAFCEIGSGVRLDLQPFPDLESVISSAVGQAYRKFFLRASVVDPLSRRNTKNNTPAIVHTRLVSGDKITVCLSVKGFGSENMGRIAALPPGSSPSEIADFVVKCVSDAGSNPCPPVIIGVGLGGTQEKAALLAKEALLSPETLTEPNKDKDLRGLEKEILARVNKLGIGPAGLGGKTTALAVRVKKFPTHIAGLPIAVNISCWALRVSRGEI